MIALASARHREHSALVDRERDANTTTGTKNGSGCMSVGRRLRFLILVVALWTSGCSISDNQQRESFGPRITPRCDRTIQAAVGDSSSDAESNLKASSVGLEPGRSTYVELVIIDDLPNALFLAVGEDNDAVSVVELNVRTARQHKLEMELGEDCTTLRLLE
jgi:hypothetical protein